MMTKLGILAVARIITDAVCVRCAGNGVVASASASILVATTERRGSE